MQLLQPESLDAAKAALGNGSVALAGGTELVPLLRSRLVEADTLVDVRGVVPRGVQGDDDRRGHDTGRARGRSRDPGCAARGLHAGVLAAAPLDGDDRRQPAAGDALLVLAARTTRASCTAARRCHAREGAHREHAIFGNERCASAHPSDPAAALLALGATIRTDRRELPVADLYRLPTEDDRDVTALEPGELILELEVPQPEASTYLKAMERNRFSFALVGVAAARTRRRDAPGARRRGADPVAARLAGRARPRHAAPGHRVQGRPRAAARPPGARSARLMIWAVVLAAGASSRFGSPKQALLLEPVLERVRASSVDDVLVVLGAHELESVRAHRPLPRLGARARRLARAAGSRRCRPKPRPRWSSSPTGPSSTRPRSTA